MCVAFGRRRIEWEKGKLPSNWPISGRLFTADGQFANERLAGNACECATTDPTSTPEWFRWNSIQGSGSNDSNYFEFVVINAMNSWHRFQRPSVEADDQPEVCSLVMNWLNANKLKYKNTESTKLEKVVFHDEGSTARRWCPYWMLLDSNLAWNLNGFFFT